jgi:tetratricopeptide (TPR) repeat protein
MAASPVLAPFADAAGTETRVAPQSPVDVRVGVSDGFTRVEFRGSQGERAQVRTEGRQTIVRLPRGAEADVSRLQVDPPRGVTSVDERQTPQGMEIVFALADGADVRSGRADGAVWLNISPPKPAGAITLANRPNPVPASGVVKVQASVDGEILTLKFPWANPAGAAVFRRGGAIYVVFDAKARLDLAEAPSSLGAVKRIQWLDGADFTVVRIEAADVVSAAASSDGANWTVVLGGPTAQSDEAVKISRDEQTGPPALTAALAGATKVVWLTDPEIGDRFAAVTAMGSVKAVAKKRNFVDAKLLATRQGVAVEAISPDLNVSIAGDLVRIARPQGLSLSAPGQIVRSEDASATMPQPAPMPGIVEFGQWSQTGPNGFVDRYRQLQNLAYEEGAKGPGAPVAARMALARFLVGSELDYEAIGLLDLVAKQNEGMLDDAEFRGLRGAARAMARRYKEAQADFSSPKVANDPASALWRGYVSAKLGDWADARKQFIQGSRAIDSFPPKWKARFAVAHAQAALELKDKDAAKSLLAYALAQPLDAPDQLKARLVQARLFEDQGFTDKALAVYQAIGRAPLDQVATPALLHATRIRYNRGMIKPADAVAELDSLRFRWRGDATEFEVIRTLGEIYLSQGRYREALEALRSAGGETSSTPAAQALQAELTDAFRKLFLQGQADGLEPIQALALFYDFRELTPVGADGDEMVRRLARRLIDVDLLPQAAELLKYQVDNRLDGVAKSQVATDLAAVYLMDHKPEQALAAIWGSRTTLLPNALNAQRRVLEARALTELTKYDNALEILGKDTSIPAMEVRAETYWGAKSWALAGATYEKRLGDRFKATATPLTGEEETWLIRSGVAYSLAGDSKSLQRLNEHYSDFITQAHTPDALRLALEGIDNAHISPSEFARAAAQADTFAGWVASMKEHFRAATEEAAKAVAATATPGKAG